MSSLWLVSSLLSVLDIKSMCCLHIVSTSEQRVGNMGIVSSLSLVSSLLSMDNIESM